MSRKPQMIRRTQPFHENMNRLNGEMERFLYAAEQLCSAEKRRGCNDTECRFNTKPINPHINVGRCHLNFLRIYLKHYDEHFDKGIVYDRSQDI